jgi:hypothetical protein
MLSLFRKDPLKKLQKNYEDKLEQAMHRQRNGDIRSYSTLMTEAEAIYKEIQNLEAKRDA